MSQPAGGENSHRTGRWTAIILIMTLVGFGLRVFRLGFQSLRGDEALTFYFTVGSFSDLLEVVRVTSHHPPLYYIVVLGWLELGGWTEFALRYPSVLPSVLLIPAVAKLAWTLTAGCRGWGGRLAAIVATLVALNPYQVFYAQDARSYPMVTLLGVLATLMLWYALKRNHWREWVVYGILVLVLMYTHFYFFLIIAFHILFVAWIAWQKRWIPWRFGLVGAVTGLLFLPWMVFSWTMVVEYEGAGYSLGFLPSVGGPLLAFAGRTWLNSPLSWVNGVAALGLMGLGGVALWRLKRSAAVLSILYLAVPLLVVFLISRTRDFYNERYLSLASPAFYLLVASALLWLWLMGRKRSWLKILAVALAALLLATGGLSMANYYFKPEFSKSPPWREVLNYIGGKSRAGDALVYNIPRPSIPYYNDDRLPSYLIPFSEFVSMEEAEDDLQSVLEEHPRIWLIPVGMAYDQVPNQVEPWMDRHSVRLGQVFFRIVHIGLYESPAEFTKTWTSQPVPFSNGIQLEGFRVGKGDEQPFRIGAGEELPLVLMWRADQQPQASYTVFTHLIGPDGMLWGQWDNPPVWGSYPSLEWSAGEIVFDQYSIPVNDGAPPGEYHLVVGLYDPNTGERSTVLDDQGQVVGDSVLLDQVILVQPE